MKVYSRTLITILEALVVAVLASACGGGGGTPTPSPTPTPIPGAEPAAIELGVASVAGKSEPELAQASGSSWDRIAFHWNEIQTGPEEGNWNWTITDGYFAGSNEPMENVLVVLTGNPNPDPWHYHDPYRPAPVDIDSDCASDFLNGNGNATCVQFTGLDEPIYQGDQINQENRWAYYVHIVTSMYTDKVAAWQIYNELDWHITSGWDYRTDEELGYDVDYWIAPDHYLDAVEVAYQVIKRGSNGNDGTDPDAKVILGGPIEYHTWELAYSEGAPWPEQWKKDWYRDVLDLLGGPREDVASHLDATALHLYYVPERAFQYVSKVADSAYLPGKPIWFTESGWRNDPSEETSAPCQEAIGCADDNKPASYILQQYAYATRAFQHFGIPTGMIFHFSFRDLDEGGQGWIEGLVSGQEGSGTPRPSYFAFQFANGNLLNLDYNESGGGDGYTYMKFTRQSDNVRVFLVWNTTDALILDFVHLYLTPIFGLKL